MSHLNNKHHIVYLGSSGFPYGLASIQRLKLISKGLVGAGSKVLIINNKSVLLKKDNIFLENKGSIGGIDYIYTSGTPYRANNILQRNLSKIYGLINETIILYSLYRKKELDAAIISTMNFHTILYYHLLSKLFKYTTLLNYTEYISAERANNIFDKLDYYFFDRYGFRLVDGTLPISDYLVKHLKNDVKNVKYLKVPVLIDVDKFKTTGNHLDDKYFLYCGSLGYFEVIEFILNTYSKLSIENINFKLYLIVSGTSVQFEKLNELVEHLNLAGHVKILTKLPDNDLYDYYQNASALLIPLRHTIQDRARFPHKIGEYLASGSPVITNSEGEVKYYLKDGCNAIIANKYDIEEYVNKMRYVINNPDISKRIGAAGKVVAFKHFDSKLHGKRIRDFIVELTFKHKR